MFKNGKNPQGGVPESRCVVCKVVCLSYEECCVGETAETPRKIEWRSVIVLCLALKTTQTGKFLEALCLRRARDPPAQLLASVNSPQELDRYVREEDQRKTKRWK